MNLLSLRSRDWSCYLLAAIQKPFVGTSKESSSLHAYNEKANYNASIRLHLQWRLQCRKLATQRSIHLHRPRRDFVGVMFSNKPLPLWFWVKTKALRLMRSAANYLLINNSPFETEGLSRFKEEMTTFENTMKSLPYYSIELRFVDPCACRIRSDVIDLQT